MIDLAIVGAGPIGLEAAIRAKRAGLSYALFDKGTIVNAIYRYPTYMTFFTTSERLEIGNHPLITATDKPTRKEALDYYRKVVANEALEIEQFTEVVSLEKTAQGFQLVTRSANGEGLLEARKVAIATGYFDNPKLLGIPGENLSHVSHYYTENHSFFDRPVVIIGAGSSAADAALDLFRGGAKVTMIHRGDDFRHSLKYWIRPNLENRVKDGDITAHFNAMVEKITEDAVYILKQDAQLVIPAVQVFALTGYFAAPELLAQAGVKVRPEDYSVVLNEETYETNVPGLYALGSAGFGTRTSDVFIENGLIHVQKAMQDIVMKQRPHLVGSF